MQKREKKKGPKKKYSSEEEEHGATGGRVGGSVCSFFFFFFFVGEIEKREDKGREREAIKPAPTGEWIIPLARSPCFRRRQAVFRV